MYVIGTHSVYNPSLSLIASLLLGRDTAHVRVLQSAVLLWRRESFESTSSRTFETPGVGSKGTCSGSGAPKTELGLEPRCLISMAMSTSDVSVGSEDQRAQGGRWVTWRRDSGRGALGERLPPGVKKSWTPPGEQEGVPSGRARGLRDGNLREVT